ncbi:hypothetical protein DASC09_013430 [Saccharomycopsis crataegensis]|uniref:Myb-like domain-containing protein n=1 Tax=Saccharomycopsis crataegensis TaxID=43959 RepID=A0AAV5QIP5_9ASCO|nr:hypothetical protein DASC09_013430 [Saccharomycopsis crataegensis]
MAGDKKGLHRHQPLTGNSKKISDSYLNFFNLYVSQVEAGRRRIDFGDEAALNPSLHYTTQKLRNMIITADGQVFYKCNKPRSRNQKEKPDEAHNDSQSDEPSESDDDYSDEEEANADGHEVYGTLWTHEEKECFFTGLSRFSIYDLASIKSLLPNKSEIQILNYYNILKKQLLVMKHNRRSYKKILSYKQLPIAHEMDEFFIEMEEAQAYFVNKEGYDIETPSKRKLLDYIIASKSSDDEDHIFNIPKFQELSRGIFSMSRFAQDLKKVKLEDDLMRDKLTETRFSGVWRAAGDMTFYESLEKIVVGYVTDIVKKLIRSKLPYSYEQSGSIGGEDSFPVINVKHQDIQSLFHDGNLFPDNNGFINSGNPKNIMINPLSIPIVLGDLPKRLELTEKKTTTSGVVSEVFQQTGLYEDSENSEMKPLYPRITRLFPRSFKKEREDFEKQNIIKGNYEPIYFDSYIEFLPKPITSAQLLAYMTHHLNDFLEKHGGSNSKLIQSEVDDAGDIENLLDVNTTVDVSMLETTNRSTIKSTEQGVEDRITKSRGHLFGENRNKKTTGLIEREEDGDEKNEFHGDNDDCQDEDEDYGDEDDGVADDDDDDDDDYNYYSYYFYDNDDNERGDDEDEVDHDDKVDHDDEIFKKLKVSADPKFDPDFIIDKPGSLDDDRLLNLFYKETEIIEEADQEVSQLHQRMLLNYLSGYNVDGGNNLLPSKDLKRNFDPQQLFFRTYSILQGRHPIYGKNRKYINDFISKYQQVQDWSQHSYLDMKRELYESFIKSKMFFKNYITKVNLDFMDMSFEKYLKSIPSSGSHAVFKKIKKGSAIYDFLFKKYLKFESQNFTLPRFIYLDSKYNFDHQGCYYPLDKLNIDHELLSRRKREFEDSDSDTKDEKGGVMRKRQKIKECDSDEDVPVHLDHKNEEAPDASEPEVQNDSGQSSNDFFQRLEDEITEMSMHTFPSY